MQIPALPLSNDVVLGKLHGLASLCLPVCEMGSWHAFPQSLKVLGTYSSSDCPITLVTILSPQALFLYEVLSRTTRRPQELLR